MKIISLNDAEQWYETLAGGEPCSVASLVKEDPSGQNIDEDHLKAIASDLVGMAREVEGRRKSAFIEFESSASVLLHKELYLLPETIACREFWTWASLTAFRELIEIRHPDKDGGMSKQANYGFRSRWDGLIFRLWSRGDQGFDKDFDSDSYYHARLGHGDMWRSHVLRVDHGSCRQVSHAFLREAYDPATSCSGAPISVAVVRKVAKNLRKLHATVPLELLSQQDAESLVREEIRRAGQS
jgi:hypothetical protein